MIEDARAWLDGHLNRELSPAVAGRVEGLSLATMESLMGVLGEPQHAYPSIHVTGTNGKGSVATMIELLVRAHGLSVGRYSSPHLDRVNERMTVNGEPIADDELDRVLGELRSAVEVAGVADDQVSWFELVTAAAYMWFAERPVDVAVVEVGLLGRFDATNVIDGQVAVVTNIGRDHTDGAPGWQARGGRGEGGHRRRRRHAGRGGAVRGPPRGVRGRWRGGSCGSSTRTSAARATRSPSAEGSSTSTLRPAGTTTSSFRCTAPTRPRTPHWP